MLFSGNQTDGNSLERFLTPYQHCTLFIECTKWILIIHGVKTKYFGEEDYSEFPLKTVISILCVFLL